MANKITSKRGVVHQRMTKRVSGGAEIDYWEPVAVTDKYFKRQQARMDRSGKKRKKSGGKKKKAKRSSR